MNIRFFSVVQGKKFFKTKYRKDAKFLKHQKSGIFSVRTKEYKISVRSNCASSENYIYLFHDVTPSLCALCNFLNSVAFSKRLEERSHSNLSVNIRQSPSLPFISRSGNLIIKISPIVHREQQSNILRVVFSLII